MRQAARADWGQACRTPYAPALAWWDGGLAAAGFLGHTLGRRSGACAPPSETHPRGRRPPAATRRTIVTDARLLSRARRLLEPVTCALDALIAEADAYLARLRSQAAIVRR